MNLEDKFDWILDFFNRDGDLTEEEIENFRETPARVAKLWLETTYTKTEIKAILEGIFSKKFPVNDPRAGMVIQGPIRAISYCPHHLKDVEYEVFVSYIPRLGGQVIGLSKIARAVQLLAKRPILQEQLARDIADVFHESEYFPFLDTDGSAVSLVGKHCCMSNRGVMSGALTAITELRGSFWESNLEQKFYQAIDNLRRYNKFSCE